MSRLRRSAVKTLTTILIMAALAGSAHSEEILVRMAKGRADFDKFLAMLDESVKRRLEQRQSDYLERLRKLETSDDLDLRQAAKSERQRFEQTRVLLDKHLVREPAALKSLQFTYRKYLRVDSVRDMILKQSNLLYRSHVRVAFATAVKRQDTKMLEAAVKEIQFLRKTVPTFKLPNAYLRTLSLAKSWTMPRWSPPTKKNDRKPKPRTWTDKTGQFKIEATLIDFKNRVARLRRTDGTIISVSSDKLSVADQQHLTQRAVQMARPPSPFDKPKSGSPTVMSPEYDVTLFSYSDLKLPGRQPIGSTIREMAATPDGATWFATNRGLVRMANGRSQFVDPFQLSDMHNVRFVRILPNGLWAVLPKHGLAHLQEGQMEDLSDSRRHAGQRLGGDDIHSRWVHLAFVTWFFYGRHAPVPQWQVAICAAGRRAGLAHTENGR